MSDREELILGSIWQRNRLAIQSKNIKKANELFSSMRSYIPSYRQLIFSGDIPKEVQYLTGAKLIKTHDVDSISIALQEAMAEEEMGATPVQIIYFNAGETELNGVLKNLDRAWIATTTCTKDILDKASFDVHEEIRMEEEVICLLDPIPEDLGIEKRIIEDTRESSKGVREFITQMKASQIHLGFKAIQDELEVKDKLTTSYLLETLNLNAELLKKIVKIGGRESRLDVSPYVEKTPPRIEGFLNKISSTKEVLLAAIFDKETLVGYAKYGDVVFPSQNFIRLSDRVSAFSETKLKFSAPWYLDLKTKNKNVFLYKNKYLYGFILDKGIDTVIFRFKVEKAI